MSNLLRQGFESSVRAFLIRRGSLSLIGITSEARNPTETSTVRETGRYINKTIFLNSGDQFYSCQTCNRYKEYTLVRIIGSRLNRPKQSAVACMPIFVVSAHIRARLNKPIATDSFPIHFTRASTSRNMDSSNLYGTCA
jgi:hypothetical protein